MSFLLALLFLLVAVAFFFGFVLKFLGIFGSLGLRLGFLAAKIVAFLLILSVLGACLG
jgi:hypothetical protein